MDHCSNCEVLGYECRPCALLTRATIAESRLAEANAEIARLRLAPEVVEAIRSAFQGAKPWSVYGVALAALDAAYGVGVMSPRCVKHHGRALAKGAGQ